MFLAKTREVQEDSAKKEARKDAEIYYHGRLSEKEPDTQASSVKESDAV